MPEAMERWSLGDAADDASGSSVVRARELPDSPAAKSSRVGLYQ